MDWFLLKNSLHHFGCRVTARTLIEKYSIWDDSFYNLTVKGVAVFPNATLTIKGGTVDSPFVVRFANETAINLRSFSSLIIEGHVHFIGSEQSTEDNMHNGRGVQIINSDGPVNLFITGLQCSYMTNCIGLGESKNSSLTIRKSIFKNNRIHINGDYAVDARVDVADSSFLQSSTQIFAQNPSSYNFSNCIFLINKDDVFSSIGIETPAANVRIQDSHFHGLSRSIKAVGLSAQNCTFEGNHIAVEVQEKTEYFKPIGLIMQDCIFENNNKPISYGGTNTNRFYIDNALFLRNIGPVEYYADQTSITNCVFAYNKQALNSGNANISSSIFIGNEIGINAHGANNLSIDNSTFHQNKNAIYAQTGYEKIF